MPSMPTFLSTVTLTEAENPPQVAVTVALPFSMPEAAVTTPFPSTVATLSSEEVHATVLSVASAGVTTAVSVMVAPGATVYSASPSMEIPSTGTTGGSPVPSPRLLIFRFLKNSPHWYTGLVQRMPTYHTPPSVSSSAVLTLKLKSSPLNVPAGQSSAMTLTSIASIVLARPRQTSKLSGAFAL